MKALTRLIITLIPVVASTVAFGEQSGRPGNLSLANFQFGPANRWAFSHIRELLPTVNIPHDGSRILQLNKSQHFGEPFSVKFQGKEQTISEVATHQFIDGILILNNGEIVVEEYYGSLTPDRPHLMMSVTKSGVGALAGQLSADGVIDLQRPVASYVPALANSGWGPDSLQILLDMKDGADYSEEYEDFNSTVRLQDGAVGWTDSDYCADDSPQGGYEFFATVGRDE